MFRWIAFTVLAMTLNGATVETTLLGTLNGAQPVVGGDGQGNVILVSSQPCSILQECQPFTLVKLDSTGKVLLRKGIGDSSWRLQVNAVTMDRAGNIVLGGSTNDANLPLVRAFRTKPEGPSEAYLMQLSPDASRVLFASYLGGNGPDQLISVAMDGAGNITAVLQTSSTDFPFTGSEGPVLPSSGPLGPPRAAIVRIVTTSTPAPARISYAIGLPVTGPPAELSMSADGTVVTPLLDISNATPFQTPRADLLEIRPDGTRRRIAVPLPGESQTRRAMPASDGGFWITGTTLGGVLPATTNAWRASSSSFSYLRWEGPQSITPPGPIRSLTVRSLEVDRADGNRIYAATLTGLARTEDNGWTWEILTTPFRNVQAMATSSDSLTSRLWVLATNDNGPAIFFSDDRGVNWKSLPLPMGLPGLPTAIAAHPTDTQVLHLAGRTTLYSTRNGGETWTQRTFSGPITSIAADATTVALVTLTSQSMFAPPTTDLRFSDDGGETFPKLVSVAFGPPSLRFDPNEPGSLYFNTGPRISRTSRDTFPIVEELPFTSIPIVQIAFQPDAPGVIVGLAADGRGQRSTDGGRSWRPLATSVTPGQVAMQIVVGAGGVVHLALPTTLEAFAGKLTANGEMTYLTYLGVRFAGATPGLTMTPNGQVVITGQMDGSADFPGQILRGTTNQFPPGFVLPTTGIDIFAIAFESDARLLYAAALVGVGPDTLTWAGAGPGSTMLVLGQTFSPDFPGVPSPGLNLSNGPTLFLTRLRP